MNRQKKDSHLFDNGVITDEAMEAYLHDALTAEEKQQFEKLLADDPFAQDALEGLRAAGDKKAVAHTITDIKKKVRERTGEKEHKTVFLHWTNYAWAAAIVGVLIGVGVVLVNLTGHQQTGGLAENKEQPVIKPAEPLSGEPKTEQKNEGTAATDSLNAGQGTYTVTLHDSLTIAANSSNKDVKVSPPPPAPAGISNGFTPATNGTTTGSLNATNSTITANVNGMGVTAPATNQNNNTQTGLMRTPAISSDTIGTMHFATKSNIDNYSDKNAALQDNEASYETVTVSGYKSEGRAAKEKKAETRKAADVTIDEAMKTFNSQDFKTASQQFDAILKKDPNNSEALYFGGIADYVNGNLQKSEKCFDKLLKAGNGYVDGSKWYKAKILLDKGKKEDAKKLLNELSNTNGSYKEKAAKKLQELQ